MSKKGVLTPKDTIYSTDTLTFTKNDTIYQVITKTLEPIVEYRTNKEIRFLTKWKYKTVKVENKAMVDSLRQELKIERSKQKGETKRVRIENCGFWCKVKIFLIGLVFGFLIKLLLPYVAKLKP